MKGEYESEHVGHIYDKHTRWYDLSMFFAELILYRLRRDLIKNAKGKILEVGVGSGANLLHYGDNCDVVGIDLSEGMMKYAERRAYARKLNLKLVKADVEELPFRNGQFDFVIDTLAFCTFKNPDKALMEMKRVCRKGGRILLLEHGIGTNGFVNWILKNREEKNYKRLGCHLTRDIEKIVKRSGLKIVEEKGDCLELFTILFWRSSVHIIL